MQHMIEFFCRHCFKSYYLYLAGKKKAQATVVCPWCTERTPTS